VEVLVEEDEVLPEGVSSISGVVAVAGPLAISVRQEEGAQPA
jgi:hypothetical protein